MMMDEIISEIEIFLTTNNQKNNLIIDIITHLDIPSQYEILDSISFLIEQKNLNTQEAIELVFNNILIQMGYQID